MADTSEPRGAGTPQPFRRQVEWGRPPATVFRAGPLPRGERLAPLPEPPVPTAATALSPAPRPATPPARSAASILSGSMIPRAAPARPTPDAPTQRAAPAADPAAGRAPALDPGSTAAGAAQPMRQPDLTVRPLPAAEGSRATAVPRVPEPALVRPQPAVPREPAAPVRTQRPGRLPLYAGAAAALVAGLGLGAWWLSRGAPATPEAAPATAADVAPMPVTRAPEAAGSPADATPLPASPGSAGIAAAATPPAGPAPAPGPTPAAPRASEPQPGSPTLANRPGVAAVTPPPAPANDPPLIVVAPSEPAPPPGPPPTAAERPPADPDAPITTRPQPLDQQ